MSAATYQTLKQKDGYILKLTQYSSPEPPKASILLLHGMAEHQKRYQSFAQYLVSNGYDVYTYDHRGHGSECKLSELGYFHDSKGYQLVIEDVIAASELIRRNNRSSRFFLFGHSMGSLIARNVIRQYDQYDGVILCGTTYPSRLLLSSGLFLSSLISKWKGPKHKSPFLNNLMFGGRKYTSFSSRTAYDWLSRSHPAVGAYVHDPCCGYICSASFYHDLLKLAQGGIHKRRIRMTRTDLPLLIISGAKDPVGGYGKEIEKFLTVLKRTGFTKVSSKLYPECRHELLNELNKEEVYSDILHWLEEAVIKK
ncbi:alpha-beta hydrolase superfamily lysophospholipase [Anaerotaenia torta]|uniref:alpha/beta fold hydrolase n=1 Tax=Anaerotaenia torta TaxID=433293 RepID=UPI003D22EE93